MDPTLLDPSIDLPEPKVNKKLNYPDHWTLEDCIKLYDCRKLVRGKIRVTGVKDGFSFVTDDRGDYAKDIIVCSDLYRNRALHGDTVFVQIIPRQNVPVHLLRIVAQKEAAGEIQHEEADDEKVDDDHDAEDQQNKQNAARSGRQKTWQDDESQMDLWNPQVEIVQKEKTSRDEQQQEFGHVVHVLPPKPIRSELNPNEVIIPNKRLVGVLKILNSGMVLLTTSNKLLPQFLCPRGVTEALEITSENANEVIVQGDYVYGSWGNRHVWPPCTNMQRLGKAFDVESEIMALLVENDVNHGDFRPEVLKEVDTAVESGVCEVDGKMEWRPTPAMYEGRRDYREERIFTIDPTTAKDLDDALHIKMLDDGRVEIGVHIADVSYFVRPTTAVDREAQKRSTTVYLVDRTIPMLPRPLCEIACSLNENVERLAFSCVWRMNVDGTLRNKTEGVTDDVWFGRSVIRSCARLDYATAQNIIDNKVATGESEEDMDEQQWPRSRRPTGGHTVDQVAADVRLMHRVAMERRRLRFDNGAIALHSTKLTFQLDEDGQTPLVVAPYPIKDSNRLVEEYMLLANYFVAEKLIKGVGDFALLRRHLDPLSTGLDKVVSIAKAATGYEMNISSSKAIHDSIKHLESVCEDEVILGCIMEVMKTPMVPANYIVAGLEEPETWKHFALHIPYYTHFTSPIRRYADVMVHRLLQASVAGESVVRDYPQKEAELDDIVAQCNKKRAGAKYAQERCDRVFLSLALLREPMRHQKGIVVSVGEKTFTVYMPCFGTSAILFLDEHLNELTFESVPQEDNKDRVISLKQSAIDQDGGERWGSLEIRILTYIKVTIQCRTRPPADVQLHLEGPWTEDDA
jgi:DIS3-like exonuclease 2